MDDIADDPMGVIKDVLEFLGLDFTSEDESKVKAGQQRRITISDLLHDRQTCRRYFTVPRTELLADIMP